MGVPSLNNLAVDGTLNTTTHMPKVLQHLELNNISVILPEYFIKCCFVSDSDVIFAIK